MKTKKGQVANERPKVSARSLRGQVAIEYLVTYGWAILVLLVIIGLIYASGIFTPTYFISEQCDLGPKFPCSHFLRTESGDLKLAITINNGFEHRIKITDIEVFHIGRNEPLGVTPTTADLASGDTLINPIEAKLEGYNPSKQSRQDFRVTIRYFSCAPEVNDKCVDTGAAAKHTITGRISAQVN